MVFDLPALGKLIYLPFEIMANRAYKLADVTVAVSDTYLQRGLKKILKRMAFVYIWEQILRSLTEIV